jgi:chemotaxis protein CheD
VHRRPEVVLNPGEFHFADHGVLIHTLLGSCVSITMWHPRLHVGGMCHYMLASRGGCIDCNSRELDGRYADEALRMFLHEIDRRLTRPSDWQVQMFGGGNQFPDHHVSSAIDVSQHNVAAGLWLLDQYGFVLHTQHLGGTGYRRLSFDVATGRVSIAHDHRTLTGSPK